MEHWQKSIGTTDAGEIRIMTFKENVQSIYPDAKCLINKNYTLIIWNKQDLEQFIIGYAETEELAWEIAWKIIQKEMLTILEN